MRAWENDTKTTPCYASFSRLWISIISIIPWNLKRVNCSTGCFDRSFTLYLKILKVIALNTEYYQQRIGYINVEYIPI